jgi:hypothetical protein
MKQTYIERKFTAPSLKLIDKVNEVADDYARQGFTLTGRSLYYKLVARNIVENNIRSYKNVMSLLNDARLAGLVDWDAIEDRTRSFITRPRWHDAPRFLKSVASQYHADMWADQPNRVFVIVEKDALMGVLEDICREYDVPLMAARGYPSVSVLREFARDHVANSHSWQEVKIIHLGDHDPSGIDMTRDLVERLSLLSGGYGKFELERIALTMEQVEENNCPANPAKLTDSRSDGYVEKYGTDSWELDALEPRYLVDLITDKIGSHIDHYVWDAREEEIITARDKIIDFAETFES